MRIISGSHRGKRFRAPKNIPTRPTTDFAKEGLFNIINNDWEFEKVSFLDLFSGTGSLSYEFASRGCIDITCVEQFPACAGFINKTFSELNLSEHVNIVQDDVFRFMSKCRRDFDLIFAGPPYPLSSIPEIPDLIFENKLLKEEGWFILEHNQDHNFEEHQKFFHVRKYGGTIFSFFRC